jgi:hypothetical protein
VRRDGPKEDPTNRPAAPVTEALINSLLVTLPLLLLLSFLCLIEISSFQNELIKRFSSHPFRGEILEK